MNPFKSAGESVQSGSRGMRICGSNARYTTFQGSVKSTGSIRQFPLHFPSYASPCAITFQPESTHTHTHTHTQRLYKKKGGGVTDTEKSTTSHRLQHIHGTRVSRWYTSHLLIITIDIQSLNSTCYQGLQPSIMETDVKCLLPGASEVVQGYGNQWV